MIYSNTDAHSNRKFTKHNKEFYYQTKIDNLSRRSLNLPKSNADLIELME